MRNDESRRRASGAMEWWSTSSGSSRRRTVPQAGYIPLELLGGRVNSVLLEVELGR